MLPADGHPWGQFGEHIGGGVHLLVQIEHDPRGNLNAEVSGKAGQNLCHEHRIGVINAEVEGGRMGLATQGSPPLQQAPAYLLQAFAGNQPGEQRHQFMFQAHAVGSSFGGDGFWPE